MLTGLVARNGYEPRGAAAGEAGIRYTVWMIFFLWPPV